jgi:hypothetical protein
MPIQFVPQFFKRPTPTPTTVPATVSAAKKTSQKPARKKYALDHTPPKHDSPFSSRVSSLTGTRQRYADIDWVHHEVITADGSRVKFGSPLYTNEDISEEESALYGKR